MRLYCWGVNTLVHHELGSHPVSVAPQCSTCPAFPRLMQHADIPEIENEDIDLASAGMEGTCAHLPMGGRTVCWGDRMPPTTVTGPLDRLSRRWPGVLLDRSRRDAVRGAG